MDVVFQCITNWMRLIPVQLKQKPNAKHIKETTQSLNNVLDEAKLNRTQLK